MASFISWQVSPLKAQARDQTVAGRLLASMPVQIQDIANPAETRTGAGDFELMGPGDVVRLAPGIISRRFPAPGAIDAEESKAALVEFAGDALLDLPWRYTPEKDRPTVSGGRGIRPWLVLVVGRAGELVLSPDGAVTVAPSVQAKHLLSGSWRWAHIHEVDGVRTARLLCPADLIANSTYIAALVPAFTVEQNGTLHDSWPLAGGGAVRLTCYDSWSFRTGPEGDFAQLAAKLRAASPAEIGPAFGRAALRYDRRGSGTPSSVDLAAGGALQLPPGPTPLPDPVPAWVADEIAALGKPIATPDRRWVLTSPRYHEPFLPPATPPASGWSGELDADPRRRGAAGLGAYAGIAWQDRIFAAAATKAGDLAIARDRIGHVALGLEATRSLWRRRLPTDPVGRLAVLGPVLGRLPATGGGTVLDQISGRTPLMTRALWSSAARRALRPGPARNRLAAPDAGRFDAVIRHASQCPKGQPDPDVVPLKGGANRDAWYLAGKAAIHAACDSDPDFAESVVERLLGGETPPPLGQFYAVLAALDPGGGAKPDRDRVNQALAGRYDKFDPGDLIDLIDGLNGFGGKPTPCRGIDPGRLGTVVAGAVDPSGRTPVVVNRVVGTLNGVIDIGPIEISPELDLPLWRFLADRAPDWLLPGVGDLRDNDVVAVATNPAFVEAMLVGANHQALGELRWRNMPIATRWSPLRKFWHRPGGKMDINPIGAWPSGAAFGAAGLSPPDIGIEAVVVFRTKLFRRYPATVVYLYADNDWVPPPDNTPFEPAKKVFPTFTGTIGDDVVFFGFPVLPAALKTHWVVLEEPPAGTRFYTETTSGAVIGQVGITAADYALKTLAVPVRVMIGKLLGGP